MIKQNMAKKIISWVIDEGTRVVERFLCLWMGDTKISINFIMRATVNNIILMALATLCSESQHLVELATFILVV